MSSLEKIQAADDPDLTVTIKTSTTISLVWDAVYNSTGYKLYRGSTLIYSGGNLQFTDTGLTPSTSYSYVVKSVHARAGDSFGSTPQVAMTLAGTVVTPTRRWAPGWHVALGGLQGNIQNTSGANPVKADLGPITTATAAVDIRYNFNDLNPSGTLNSNFDFTLPLKHLSDLAKFNSLGTPVLLYMMIIQRTFGGSIAGTFTTNVAGQTSATLNGASSSNIASGTYGVTFQDAPGAPGNAITSRINATAVRTGAGTQANPYVTTLTWSGALPTNAGAINDCCVNPMNNCPMPTDLRAYSEPFFSSGGNVVGGWQGWRWSPVVLARFELLCQRIEAVLGTHPNFGGIATQETSTGGAIGGSGTDAYSASRFIAALSTENDSIVNNLSVGRAKHYVNQIHGNGSATAFDGFLDHVVGNGAIIGPPDWVTDRAGGGLPTHIYLGMQKYQNGTNPVSGTGPTMLSMQNGEFTGSGAGDPTPVNPYDLYNYATQSNTYAFNTGNNPPGARDHRPTSALPSVTNISVGVIDYHLDPTPPNNTVVFADLVPIMKAHPLFNNPWTPPTTGGGTGIDYYISPTGSNSNDGLTTSTPWAITALNQKRTTYTGKTVGLMDGTYNLSATLNDGSHTDVDQWALDCDGGTASAPTIIKAVNARQAVLTGKNGSVYGNTNGTPLIGHSGGTTHRGYITFDGLKITGCPRMGIRIGINGVNPLIAGVTVKNCEFTDFNGTAMGPNLNLEQLEINNTTGILVQNNYFHDSVGYSVGSTDHFSAVLQWKSDRATYEYNTVINAGSIYGKEDGQFGTTVRYNYIEPGVLNDVAPALQDFCAFNGSAATTTSIHHNVLIGGHCWNGFNSIGDTEAVADILQVYNNTCVMNPSGASRGLRVKAVAGRGSLYNNIVYDTASGDHTAMAINVDIDGILDYNLYFSSTGNLQLSTYPNASSTVRSTVGSLAAFQSATGADAHSLVSNPLFTGTGARALAYQLQAGSPAVNAGKSNGLIGGTTCDVGAWGNSPPARIGCDF